MEKPMDDQVKTAIESLGKTFEAFKEKFLDLISLNFGTNCCMFIIK